MLNYNTELESARNAKQRLDEIERLQSEAAKLPALEKQYQAAQQQQLIREQATTAQRELEAKAKDYREALEENNKDLQSAINQLSVVLEKRKSLGQAYDSLIHLAAVSTRTALTRDELNSPPSYLADRQKSLATSDVQQRVGRRLSYETPHKNEIEKKLIILLSKSGFLIDQAAIIEARLKQQQMEVALNRASGRNWQATGQHGIRRNG